MCAIADQPLPTVLFSQEGQIDLATSHWLLSLKIDLRPYGRQLGHLEQEVDYFHKSVNSQLSPFLDSPSANNTEFRTIVISLNGVIQQELSKFDYELDMLRLLYKSIRFSFLDPPDLESKGEGEDIDNISENEKAFEEDYFDYGNTGINSKARSKRSIFGWLSPVISSLFGTPSEQSWKLAQQNLRNLHETTEALRQSLGHTLQIINVTNENVKINRAAIADLAADLKNTRGELNEILSSIQNQIDDNLRLNTLIEKIQGLFHVAASSLRVAMYQMMLLKSDLELAKQGNFAPTLVSEAQLKTVLRKIKADLPKDTFLPRNVKQAGWYYANLPVHMISDSIYVYIIIDLPLINMGNNFDLYRIIQFPGLTRNEKLKWEINSPYLAVSHDKEKYVSLSNVDAQICKQGFCKPNVVMMSYLYNENCAVSLFKNDSEKVWKNCNAKTEELSKSPKIIWKHGNTWLAEACVGEKFNLICGSVVRPTKKIQIYQIVNQLERISIPSDCWLKGRLFTTPRMLTPSSTFKIPTNVSFGGMDLKELKVKTEDRMDYQTLRSYNSSITPGLKDVSVDIDIEQRKLNSIDNKFVNTESSKGVKWYIVAVPVLAVLLVACAMLMFYVKRYGGMVGFQSLARKPSGRSKKRNPEPTPMEMIELTNTNINYANIDTVPPSSTERRDPVVRAKPPAACPKPANPLIPSERKSGETYSYAMMPQSRGEVQSYLEPGYFDLQKN